MSSTKFKPRNTARLRQMEQRLQKIQSDARRAESEIRRTEAEFRRAEGEFRRLDTELRRDVQALERDARGSPSDPDGTLATYVEPLRERFPSAPEASLENAARLQIGFRDFSLNMNRLAMRFEPDSREPALRDMAEIDRHLPGGLTAVERDDISFLATVDAWRAAGENTDEPPAQVAEALVTTTPEPDAPPPRSTKDEPSTAKSSSAPISAPKSPTVSKPSANVSKPRRPAPTRRFFMRHLVREVAEIGSKSGRTVYVLENPTTGNETLDGIKEFSDNVLPGASVEQQIVKYIANNVSNNSLRKSQIEWQLDKFNRTLRRNKFSGVTETEEMQLRELEERMFQETSRGRAPREAYEEAIAEIFGPEFEGRQGN